MRKKILFFLPSLMGGGAERTFVNLLNHLDRSDYEPVLLLLSKSENGYRKDAYSQLLHQDVRCINLGIPMKTRYYPAMLFRLCQTIRQEKPDIVLSTTIKANLLAAGASTLSRVRHHLVLRESNNQMAMEHGRLFNWLVGVMYRQAADWIITPSRGLKEMLQHFYSVPAGKISAIPNMLDLEQIESKMQEETILSQDPSFKIVTAGRLEQQKDHKTLLLALRLLPPALDYHCYILGDGSLRKQIEEQVLDYGLVDRVHLIGFQDNPYSFMHDADLFVLSSCWEGLGNVLLESLAVRTVPLSSDCPHGPGEILAGNPDLLYPVGDEEALSARIQAFASDRMLSKRISEWGQERIKDYLPERIIKEYGGLFHALSRQLSEGE